MQKNLLKQILGFGLALDIIILDQLSKWYVLEFILKNRDESAPMGIMEWLFGAPERLPHSSVEILPYFNIVMVWNQGISFGLFRTEMPWILVGVALVITVLFSIWLIRSKNWVQIIPLAMVIGGALGNVIDRVRFGAVADFLDFHAFGWHYPAFNLADSCITVGIVILVLDGLFLEPKRKEAHI